MTIDLYYMPCSAPCRAIQMTAAAVGVELNLKFTDLLAGAHLTDEFFAVNPQRMIPVLIDNGFVLTESRAICAYLVDRYGKPDDSLYPRDPQQRALINQRLYFDMGTVYLSMSDYYYPLMFGTATAFVPDAFKKIEQMLEVFNSLLEGRTYATGKIFTIADISLLASLSSFVHSDHGFELGEKYPNVTRWFNQCKLVAPRNDLNEVGVQEFRDLMNLKINEKLNIKHKK